MRPGPKFELTREMIVENIKVVAQRLGITRLSYWDYEEHGSFSPRAAVRKWSWRELCAEAGVATGKAGRPVIERKVCFECEVRATMTNSRYCNTCAKRMQRNSGGLG